MKRLFLAAIAFALLAAPAFSAEGDILQTVDFSTGITLTDGADLLNNAGDQGIVGFPLANPVLDGWILTSGLNNLPSAGVDQPSEVGYKFNTTLPAGSPVSCIRSVFTYVDAVNVGSLQQSLYPIPLDMAGVRNFTARIKFYPLTLISGNDIRMGVIFPTFRNQSNQGIQFKIGQGDDPTQADKKDVQFFVNGRTGAIDPVETNLTDHGTVFWGQGFADDTDYALNQWYTVELRISTSAAGPGFADAFFNGARFCETIPIRTLTDAQAGRIRFQIHGWNNTVGEALFDDLEIINGIGTYPKVSAELQGTPNTKINLGSGIFNAVNFAPSPVDFGTVASGNVNSAGKVIVIKNNGTADLTTSNLAFTGGFALKTGESLAATIAPGASDTVEVVMEAVAGVKTGTLTFNSNDFNVTINLAGEVTGVTSVEGWRQY